MFSKSESKKLGQQFKEDSLDVESHAIHFLVQKDLWLALNINIRPLVP